MPHKPSATNQAGEGGVVGERHAVPHHATGPPRARPHPLKGVPDVPPVPSGAPVRDLPNDLVQGRGRLPPTGVWEVDVPGPQGTQVRIRGRERHMDQW